MINRLRLRITSLNCHSLARSVKGITLYKGNYSTTLKTQSTTALNETRPSNDNVISIKVLGLPLKTDSEHVYDMRYVINV